MSFSVQGNYGLGFSLTKLLGSQEQPASLSKRVESQLLPFPFHISSPSLPRSTWSFLSDVFLSGYKLALLLGVKFIDIIYLTSDSEIMQSFEFRIVFFFRVGYVAIYYNL